MKPTTNHNQLSFALALLILAVVACACPNSNDNRRYANTNGANTQSNSPPVNAKPGPKLSRNELEQSFRQMLASNFSCFDYVKTTCTHYKGEYVLAGAPTGPKDWCAEYVSKLDFTDEKKKADDWVTENSASLVAAKVTHVNVFYCTDAYGRACHFLHAINVK
ncbi:MAG: hypothetical protein QOF62_1031 [Pyrinomonadaceae bacterium]|jgi:hypothetical protein|nr:hypothetical protein [Pyrinomonadaceae bacterium]